MEIARQDACGQFPQERLEQARDRVRIPVLVGSEQIHVALCSFNGKHATKQARRMEDARLR